MKPCFLFVCLFFNHKELIMSICYYWTLISKTRSEECAWPGLRSVVDHDWCGQSWPVMRFLFICLCLYLQYVSIFVFVLPICLKTHNYIVCIYVPCITKGCWRLQFILTSILNLGWGQGHDILEVLVQRNVLWQLVDHEKIFAECDNKVTNCLQLSCLY